MNLARQMTRYGVERLLAAEAVPDLDWIGQVADDPSLAGTQAAQVQQYLGMESMQEQVEFLLQQEYGPLPPELRGCQWELVTVGLEQLDFAVNQLDPERLEQYGRSGVSALPQAVVLQTGSGLRVIDGRHRLTAHWEHGHRRLSVLQGNRKR